MRGEMGFQTHSSRHQRGEGPESEMLWDEDSYSLRTTVRFLIMNHQKFHIFTTDWKWTILTVLRVSCSGIISHFIVHLNVQQVLMRHKCGAIMLSVETDKMVNPVWPCEDIFTLSLPLLHPFHPSHNRICISTVSHDAAPWQFVFSKIHEITSLQRWEVEKYKFT